MVHHYPTLYLESGLNQSRRKVNKDVYRTMSRGLGSVIGHLDIHLDRLELYRGDGVHLSEQGIQIFLRGIQRGREC